MNPMMLMKIKGLIDKFKTNHPKVPLFFNDAARSIGEGSIIEISITTAEGRNLCTNMRVTRDDLELVEQLKNLNN
ncbi:MAG: hypothetical protein IKL53_07375 [Lachnospiraceae bacterium]|nr:hypothetical protein [Lachnospiraceae bacterium]MBR3599685.1 hypothetical protein [Lachnospiraceae bacterium]